MIEFLQRHIGTIVFYVAVFLFVYLNRKRFDIHYKFIALYRTQWGLKAMDAVANRFREAVKLYGYIGVGVAFIAMFAMVGLLLHGLFTLFTQPDAPPAISPVLPGVAIPGGIFIPLAQGLLAIFIIALLHEYAHGVVARAFHVGVKSSGPAIVGPFFAAFVEPDEQRLPKQPDIVQYAVFAAGSFTNILMALFAVLIMVAAINPLAQALYPAQGITFSEVDEDSGAQAAGLEPGAVYTEIDGAPLLSVQDLVQGLEGRQPGQNVTLATQEQNYTLTLGAHPQDAQRAYIGIIGLEPVLSGQGTAGFAVLRWIASFTQLLFALSLGIGFANLLPLGPLDGGRMFSLAATRLRGKKKGQKVWAKVSLIILLILLILLTPVLKATAQFFLGLF